MPTGIIIEWRDETEYIDAIDPDNLDQLERFDQTRAWWPNKNKERFVHYNVNCKIQPSPNQFRVIVTYKRKNNEDLRDHWDDVIWGTNKIIITPGENRGSCDWYPEGKKQPERVTWKGKKLREERNHRRSHQQVRDDKFRPQILDLDNKRCVITGESTIEALDAAHIIPAAEDGNEIPENGITLRADIHRLYDAGKFFIDPKTGKPKRIAADLSEKYREILERGELLEQTLERVRYALRERWPG